MSEVQTRAKQLLEKWLDGSIETSEKQIFLDLYGQDPSMVEALIDEQLIDFDGSAEMDGESKAAVLAAIFSVKRSQSPGVHTLQQVQGGQVHFLKRFRWVAAAVFLFAIATTWLLINKNESRKSTVTADVKAPTANRATIRLANGKTVFLDSVNNGQLATLGQVQLVKLADGKIVYQGDAGEITYNTISNPRGSRVIDMELTDGSHVWLNAGSSMTYPVPFESSTRNVEISGEAYFEVAKNKNKPFIVKTPTDRIEVLGTHFNINSYPDETGVKTTLLEGSVKIGTVILKPGEQYGLGKTSVVNTDAVVAWVHGFFQFEHADIRTVMRQLSRWYDLDVRYEGTTTTELFGGEIPRDLTVSKVLNAVSQIGIHYTLDGKTIVIQP